MKSADDKEARFTEAKAAPTYVAPDWLTTAYGVARLIVRLMPREFTFAQLQAEIELRLVKPADSRDWAKLADKLEADNIIVPVSTDVQAIYTAGSQE